MRVVMIGPFGLKPKGTMSVRALPMARALAARGHQVTVLLPPWSNPDDSGRSYEGDGVRVENIRLPPGFPLAFHVLVTQRLISRARKLEPDVIHCFKPKAYAGLSAYWIWRLKRARLWRVRLVVDEDDWEGAGGWNDRERYSWAQRRVFAWQEQWGLSHNDALTVASRALESIVLSLGVPHSRVFYVPNGVEAGSWKVEGGIAASNLQPPTSNTQSPTILLYTRFFEFGVERVADVFTRVLQSVRDARLLVVGKGLFGEEERLLELARSAGWGDRVEYAGWIAPERLPEMFARADAAIFPFDDTLLNRTKCPVKLADLLAAGVPVVADAVGQNVEYIQSNETGILVPSGDAEAMAHAVTALVMDRARAAWLGRAAAHDMRARFGWNRLVESVERAYTAP